MKKKYIYNYELAYHFMRNGIMPCSKPQVHFKTKVVFFEFEYTDELEELYVKWNNNRPIK